MDVHLRLVSERGAKNEDVEKIAKRFRRECEWRGRYVYKEDRFGRTGTLPSCEIPWKPITQEGGGALRRRGLG